MNICRRSAHIDDHEIANDFLKHFGAFHDRTRCRENSSAHHFMDFVHPFGMYDVLFEDFLNDFSCRLNIQHIHLGIDILGDVELSFVSLKNLSDVFYIVGISCIDDRYLKAKLCDFLGIVERSITLSVIESASNHDDVRPDFSDLFKIRGFQPAGCDLPDDRSGAKGSFP